MNLRASPEWIVDTLEPRALLAEARLLPTWEEEISANLDHALCQWTRNACAHNNDIEGLLELQAVLGWLLDAVEQRAEGDVGHGLRARWQAFWDLTEAHRIVLAARDPAGVRQRKHVDPILAALGDGETEQRALRAKVGLSESRLTQLLHLLEAHGLIERRKQGRTNLVRLTAQDEGHGARARRAQQNGSAFGSYLTLTQTAA